MMVQNKRIMYTTEPIRLAGLNAAKSAKESYLNNDVLGPFSLTPLPAPWNTVSFGMGTTAFLNVNTLGLLMSGGSAWFSSVRSIPLWADRATYLFDAPNDQRLLDVVPNWMLNKFFSLQKSSRNSSDLSEGLKIVPVTSMSEEHEIEITPSKLAIIPVLPNDETKTMINLTPRGSKALFSFHNVGSSMIIEIYRTSTGSDQVFSLPWANIEVVETNFLVSQLEGKWASQVQATGLAKSGWDPIIRKYDNASINVLDNYIVVPADNSFRISSTLSSTTADATVTYDDVNNTIMIQFPDNGTPLANKFIKIKGHVAEAGSLTSYCRAVWSY